MTSEEIKIYNDKLLYISEEQQAFNEYLGIKLKGKITIQEVLNKGYDDRRVQEIEIK